MKHSIYKGQHKGSTLKARAQTVGESAFKCFLAFVLAVGLAPSLSYATGTQVTEPEGAVSSNVISGEPTEPTNDEPIETPSSDESDEADESDIPDGNVSEQQEIVATGADDEEAPEPVEAVSGEGEVASKEQGGSYIKKAGPRKTVAKDTVTIKASKDAEEGVIYSNEKVKITISVSGFDTGDTASYTIAGYGKDTASPVALEASSSEPTKATAEIEIGDTVTDGTEQEFTGTISVTVTPNGGTAQEPVTFTTPIVVDKKAPEIKDFKFDIADSVKDGSDSYFNLTDGKELKLTATASDLSLKDKTLEITGLTDPVKALTETKWTDNGDGTWRLEQTFTADNFVNASSNVLKAAAQLKLTDKANHETTARPAIDSTTMTDAETFTSENALLKDGILKYTLKPGSNVKKSDSGNVINGIGSYEVAKSASWPAGTDIDTAATGTKIKTDPTLSGSWVGQTYSVVVPTTTDSRQDYKVEVELKTTHGATATLKGDSFAVDTTKPKITVTPNASAPTQTITKDGAMHTRHIAKATTDAFFEIKIENAKAIQSEESIEVSLGEGLVVKGNALSWTKPEPGTTWTATVKPSDFGTKFMAEEEYGVAVTAKDLFNEGVTLTSFTDTFMLDSASPVVDFKFIDLKKGLKNDDEKISAIFKAGTGTVLITVTDASLFKDIIDGKGDIASDSGFSTRVTASASEKALSAIVWKPADADSTKVQAEVPYSVIRALAEQEEWGLTVTAQDIAGNSQTTYKYADDDKTVVSGGDKDLKGTTDKLKNAFILDGTPVSIVGMDFGSVSSATYDGYTVYEAAAGTITPTLTVTDTWLDADASTVAIYVDDSATPSDSLMGKGSSGDKDKWVQAGPTGTWELKHDFASGHKYKVVISADDYARNGSTGVSEFVFAVDKEKPAATITFDSEVSGSVDTAACYNAADTVKATFKATDDYFIDASQLSLVLDSSISTSVALPTTESDWTKVSEKEYIYETSFPKSAKGETYAFTLTVKDKMGETHKVTKSYADVQGSKSGCTSFVVDNETPKLVVTGIDGYTKKEVVEGVQTYYFNSDKSSITVSGLVQDNYTILAYDAILGAGMQATVAKDDAVESTVSSTQSDLFDKIFGNSGYTITADGTYSFRVSGTDAAGNKLDSVSENDLASEGLKDGEYEANIVYDATRPTVKVAYKAGSSATEIPLAYDKEYANYPLTKDDITVVATFHDASKIDKDKTTFTYTLNNRAVQKATPIWSGTDEDPVATFSVNVDADTDAICKLTIDSYDQMGNKLAGDPSTPAADNPFTAQVEIDKHAPEVEVKPVQTQAGKNSAGTVDYFADNVDVAVTIKDHNFDEANNTPAEFAGKNLISIDGSSAPLVYSSSDSKWSKSDAADADGNYTYTYTVSFSDEGSHIVAVDVHDTAGNEADGSYTNDKATSFIIDKTDPNVFVEMNKVRAGQAGEKDYYADEVTATITVEDVNFDSEANKPKDVIRLFGTPAEGSISIPDSWTDAGGSKYSVDVVFSDSKSDDAYYFTATPVDLAKRTTSYAYGASNTDTTTPSDGGVMSTTGPSDDMAAPFSTSFVVDTVAPDISITMREGVVNSHNGHDYYATTTNGGLVAAIAVTDRSFDSEKATVTDESGAPLSHAEWVRSGDTYSTTVTFTENYGTYSTLVITASDAISALKNGEHVTSYGYGEASKSGNPKGGNVSTTAASGTVKNTSFVLDLTAPVLTANESTGFATKWGASGTPYLFYTAGGSGIRVNMSDINEIEKAEVTSPFELSTTSALGRTSNQTIKLIQGVSVSDRDAKNAIMQGAFLKLTDYAGNYSVWNITATGKIKLVQTGREVNASNPAIGIRDGSSVHPTVMVLDTVAPYLEWGSRPSEGQYYNSAQSAVLNLTELNFDYLRMFDGGRNIATISRAANSAGAGYGTYRTYSASDFSGSASNWAATLGFNDEGHYTVEASFSDIAGNTSNTVRLAEFTLDWTAPTATITWDNNNARNGMYYNAGRTATITVTEHNFLASDFTIQTTGSIGGWSSNGDTHTCVVSFATDGRYTLSVSGHDRAGNAMATITEPEFVIDLTAPTIDFSNVTERTAYNGEIAPVINYHDEANFDSAGMTYTLTGNKHGARTFNAGQGSTGNDGTVSYENFPYEVESDDIYTLDAHLVDMAGNEADNSITFSVNRFGSNFIVLDADEFSERNGFLPEAREIVVQEINVSGSLSEEHGVTVTHGLNTENLQLKDSGTATSDGFFIKSGSDNAGWSSYEYHVGSGNFTEDGNYHVVINSIDTATNRNSSASYYDPEEHAVNDAEVSFILDQADPIIENVSVSDNGTYNAATSTLSFTVTDNIDINTVKVTVDGEEQMVQPEMGGLCTVDIPAKTFTGRDMEIVATDYADRSAEVTVKNFHWTTDFVELNLPLVIGGVVVIAGGVIGGVVYVRRRNGEQ